MEIVPQKFRSMKIVELTPHPANPNQADIGAIHTSIEANGFYGAIVVQKSTGYVLAGNHRLIAAQQAGATNLPVIEVDVDDATALRILLADNRIAALATNDMIALTELLQAIAAEEDGLIGTGYDGDDLDVLLSDLAASAAPKEDYSTKIESPIYKPTGEQPPVTALADTDRRDLLLGEIEAADVPDDVRGFLVLAAQRHTRFDYETIANYYAHAPTETQRLMEASALVIIDYGQAVERGFVTLHEAVDDAFQQDYPDA